jgi:hypothetical protein
MFLQEFQNYTDEQLNSICNHWEKTIGVELEYTALRDSEAYTSVR